MWPLLTKFTDVKVEAFQDDYDPEVAWERLQADLANDGAITPGSPSHAVFGGITGFWDVVNWMKTLPTVWQVAAGTLFCCGCYGARQFWTTRYTGDRLDGVRDAGNGGGNGGGGGWNRLRKRLLDGVREGNGADAGNGGRNGGGGGSGTSARDVVVPAAATGGAVVDRYKEDMERARGRQQSDVQEEAKARISVDMAARIIVGAQKARSRLDSFNALSTAIKEQEENGNEGGGLLLSNGGVGQTVVRVQPNGVTAPPAPQRDGSMLGAVQVPSFALQEAGAPLGGDSSSFAFGKFRVGKFSSGRADGERDTRRGRF